MQQTTQSIMTGVARHYLLFVLRKLDEEIVKHLKGVAQEGGIQGNSPRADLYAHIASKALNVDLNELDDEEARLKTKEFKIVADLRILPPGGMDPIERFFQNVELGMTPTDCEELRLLVECCELALDDREDERSTGV